MQPAPPAPHSLEAMIAEVEALEPLSNTAHALLELLQREDYSLVEVTKLVEADGVLTANLLKVVNAPSFGLGQSVSSVSRAVGFLGDKLVVGIALGSCAQDVFNHALQGYGGHAGQLWEHSLATAIGAREFAKLLNPPNSSGLAYTAGILHDIGKAVLSAFLTQRTQAVLAAVDSLSSPSFDQAEASLLGASHTTLGAMLAAHWRLPEPLVQAIAHHHAPHEADPAWQALCCAVQFGDALAMSIGADTGADALLYPVEAETCAPPGLTECSMEQLLLTVQTEFYKTRTLFFGDA